MFTKQNANIAERGIRYSKKRMDDKLEDDRFRDEEPESYWKKHYQEAGDHYNKENKQDTINMTPEDATKAENEFDVKTSLEIKARHDRKYPELEVGDIVRKFKKREKFQNERTGDYEEGTRKVMVISKSMGQHFYKLDNDDHQYLRADVHLIKKGPGARAEGGAAPVGGDVNDKRNLRLDDDEREVQPPADEEEAKAPEWAAYKKMNKKDREKALGKMRKETEKAVAGERKDQLGGSSGSGIPRDPATGRAL